MTDRIIEAKISLKTIVNILSCFGFHIEETILVFCALSRKV